jgi:hypothetical protein
MIARDSRGSSEDARVLSDALAQRLREAIGDRWRARQAADVERTSAALAAVLREAAAEAHARALHPEDLVLAIKALEGQVAGRPTELTPGDRSALRAWLVTVCIRAYFSAP